MTRALALICLAALWAGPGGAQEAAPLSAIDWLSESVTLPAPAPRVPPDEPPVATDATSPTVTVTPLDSPSPDRVGLLGPATTGLPRSLWSGSAEATLVNLIRADAMPSLPAIDDFTIVLMLAEADPPLGASSAGALFLARVDRLLQMGALNEAQALLEEAGSDTPALFRRWFDVALLTGTEDAACDVMLSRPAIAPTQAARIFCLARSGDWPAAALTLNTSRVLGDLSGEDEALLSRFLDPDLFEDEPPLPPPSRANPLDFRMREAIGQRMPTRGLPLAFSHADLRDTAGLKAQLEAAERLARAGVLPPNTLQGLFTARRPSASGGIWDRVAAFQRFDAAMRARDADAVAEHLPDVWEAMQTARAEVLFATLYADQIAALPLPDAATALALRIGLLSPMYETIVRDAPAAPAFLKGLATGEPGTPRSRMEEVIVAGFEGTPPAALIDRAENGQLGEALLRAIATFNAGLDGDPRQISDALALFRAVGLEDLARRSALQLLLLERAS